MRSGPVIEQLRTIPKRLTAKRNLVQARQFARSAQSSLSKLDQASGFSRSAARYAANPVVQKYVPICRWLPNYDRKDLSGDMTAGLVVAIMLVPQSMAYALLAGLPPQIGLYASILPLIAYAVFGSSKVLAVGPVAIVSLMVASALSPMAEAGSPEFIAYAVALSAISGLFLLALGIFRLGFIANFISHPVIAGFTSAAALVIGFSQFKHLLGIEIERTYFIPQILSTAFSNIGNIDLLTLVVSVFSVVLLSYRNGVSAFAQRQGLNQSLAGHLPRAMALVVVVIGTIFAAGLGWLGVSTIKTVGTIPRGLPPIGFPALDLEVWQQLLPAAILISMVGFLESVSVAKSLASKRRQKISPDQEFVGLGAANIGAALSGGYSVTGGFSRSGVNFSAGANTQLASIITAVCIALTLMLLTPLLYFLPKAVLAAIIIVAVAGLIDFKSFFHAWDYSRVDGLGYLATFLGVLVFGAEAGIAIGISCSLALHLWRTSRPHLAVVGRVGKTEHFRNILRHEVSTRDDQLLVRIDESLYFANAGYLEDRVLAAVADQPTVRHFVLICSAVNAIDASALETLEHLVDRLKDSGVTLHLAEVKGPVMDRLEESDFLKKMDPGSVFISTHEAVEVLGRLEMRGAA